MTFQQLELFCLLAEQKKQSLVSSILYISQPAISNSIHALEKECGHTLFIRKSHNLELTTFGEYFYLKAKQIVLEKSFLTQFCEQYDDNQLRIGLTPSFADIHGYCFYNHLIQTFPSTVFTFQINSAQELIRQLSLNHLDIILSDHRDTRFFMYPIYTDTLGIFCTLDYPIESVISLSELSAHPLLLRNKGCGNRSIIDSVFTQHNISPKIIVESSSNLSLIQLLKAGNGLGILFKSMVNGYYERSLFKEIALENEVLQRHFYFLWKKSSIESTFLSCLQQSTLDFFRFN